MHKILKHVASLVLMCVCAVHAAAIPEKPYPPRLVNDFAGLLDYSQRAALERKLTAFSDTTSNQIAVVTVEDLEGYSPAEYGTEIGIRWQVGSAKFDNGIVVLVKPKTASSPGQVNISVGYGLEGAIPDSYAKRIINNEMIPAFMAGDYYTGIDNACTVLMQLASGEISEYDESGSSGLAAALAAIVIFIVIMAIIVGIGHKGGGNGGGGHVNDGGDFFRGLVIGDILGSAGSGSRGGFGGGGFGSGGFGGFGGGSFGGGGASGSW